MDKVWQNMQDGADYVKEWIIAHQSNPFLWIGLFLAGLLVFFITYNALQREK